MKHNLRKLLAVLVLGIAVLGLTACSSASTEPQLTFEEEEPLHSVADFLIESWNSMDVQTMTRFSEMKLEDAQELVDAYGFPFEADAFRSAFAGYLGSMEDLGAYVSTDEYEPVVVDGDELTLNVNLTYENRTAELSIVFNEKRVVQSVAINPDYSGFEILEKAVLNTILGMGTVFAVLILISGIIYCFNYIPAIQSKFTKKKEEPKAAERPEPVKRAPAPAAPVPAAEELVDDGELVAAITAAICAYSGTSSDGFVVRSIRRAESAKWRRA